MRMKKWLLTACTAAVVLWGCSGQGNEDRESVDAQIRMIATQRDVWKDSVEKFGYENYAVTDMNGNGRLELITAVCGGTGRFTYSNVYEVNESFDGLRHYKILRDSEGDSQPDIITSPVPVYYDSENERYYYVFHDFVRLGIEGHTDMLYGYWLEDGEVQTKMIAYYSQIYDRKTDRIIRTYKDAEDNEISEEAYNQAEAKAFSGMEKRSGSIGWKVFDEEMDISSAPAKVLEDMFFNSWKEFKQ